MVLKTDKIKIFEDDINLFALCIINLGGGKRVLKNIFVKSIKILKK